LTQVDAVTYRRLHNRYTFDEMQQIHVKGKGLMQVYNLLGSKVAKDQGKFAGLPDAAVAQPDSA
ncbi:MAG: hypothetical protein LH481_08225, partial [Burkholderiales bacterium]|nr:hypothetical protein [Burkholderiales bacterium]